MWVSWIYITDFDVSKIQISSFLTMIFIYIYQSKLFRRFWSIRRPASEFVCKCKDYFLKSFVYVVLFFF